jgi:hypothetical protein
MSRKEGVAQLIHPTPGPHPTPRSDRRAGGAAAGLVAPAEGERDVSAGHEPGLRRTPAEARGRYEGV